MRGPGPPLPLVHLAGSATFSRHSMVQPEPATAREWTAVYRRYGEAVHRRARRLLRDDAAARDAVQETFLRAWRFRDGYRGDSLTSWLFTIADRVCFDTIGRRRPTSDLADLEGPTSQDVQALEAPLPSAEARVLRDELLRRVLAHADDETRAILVGRYVDELDTAAIGARIGASERTVRRRLEDYFARARTAADSGPHVRPPEVSR